MIHKKRVVVTTAKRKKSRRQSEINIEHNRKTTASNFFPFQHSLRIYKRESKKWNKNQKL